MSDGKRRVLSRSALASLLVLAMFLNVSLPGRSDHLNATNETASFLNCTPPSPLPQLLGYLQKSGTSHGPLLPGSAFSYQIDLIPLLGARAEPRNLIVEAVRRLVDPLPADFRFESLAIDDPTSVTCTSPPVGSSGTISCDFPDPRNFYPNSIDVFGQISPDAAPGVLTNTATLELNYTQNANSHVCVAQSSWLADVVSPANVTADKTVSGDFFVGGTISYQVVLTNSGPAPQVDATGDELADVLPPELELDCDATSVVSGGGVLDCDEGSNTVRWNGSIPAAGTVTLEIGATILAGTPGAPIENQGILRFDADGDGSHDTNGTTDDPGTAPDPDPTALVLGIAVSEVPVAGAFGLLALAVLLALAALPRLRD